MRRVELAALRCSAWTRESIRESLEPTLEPRGLSPGAAERGLRSFKKRKTEKASTPRVAALLQSLQKSKSHEAVPQGEGRVELRIELAAGGKQRSFWSEAEYEELKRLIGA